VELRVLEPPDPLHTIEVLACDFILSRPILAGRGDSLSGPIPCRAPSSYAVCDTLVTPSPTDPDPAHQRLQQAPQARRQASAA
jgi:hypothetical protein